MASDKDDHQYRRDDVERIVADIAGKEIPEMDNYTRRLLHDLHVDRTELEMQNDELRSARERLEECQARCSELYDQAPVGYLSLDESGRILQANLTAAEQLGIDRNRLVNKPLAAYVAGEDLVVLRETLQAAARDSARRACEVRIRPRVGKPFFAKLDVVVTHEEVTSKNIWRVAFTDVSELRAIEQDLRESRDRLQILCDTAQEAIIFTDGMGTITSANPAAYHQLGYPSVALLGMRIFDLQVPPGTPAVLDQLDGYQSSAMPAGELTIVRPDGARRVFDFTARELDTDQHITFLHDVTARKESEQQVRDYADQLEQLVEERAERIRVLEHQRALSERVAATGRMAARIAHEINNPLAGIRNAFLLLKSAVPEDHPYAHYVPRIVKEIDRIARIVRQMFDLYRHEKEPSQRFDVGEAIQDIALMLAPLSQQHEVRIQAVKPDCPIILLQPESLVRQVLFNVVANAIEASPAGETVKVNAVFDEANVAIAVVDKGHGITAEAASRIFEPFFTTKKGQFDQGLGLGLAVSRNLVEMMGGTLNFYSRPGEGTVFRIVLPQAVPQPSDEDVK